MRIKTGLALLLGLCWQSAMAHEIWLEPHQGGVRLAAGEYHVNAREGEGSELMGKLGALTAQQWRDGKWQAAVSGKAGAGSVHFALAPQQGSVKLEASGYPVFDSELEGKPVRAAWFPAARLIEAGQSATPALKLDVLPGAQAGEFVVWFDGKPLAGIEVEVFTPSGWLRKFESDAQGRVQLALPWRGEYVLAVSHQHAGAGELNGEAYQLAYYGTTLNYQHNSGLPALPAQAAGKLDH